MTIKSSGVLKMSDIVAEFGGIPPYNLSNYYGGGPLVPAGIGVPSSGLIRFSDFYGKTKTMNNYLNATPGPYSGVVPAGAWAAKVIIRGGGGGGSVGVGTNGGGGSVPGCGGGCGYHQSFVIPVTAGQPFSGYIGAGGPGGYVGGGVTTYWIAESDGDGNIISGYTGPYASHAAAVNAAANLNSNDGTGNWVAVDQSLAFLHNGSDGGATTFVYNGTTYTANGGQGAGSVNHNPSVYTLFTPGSADGYPGAGEYAGSWPYSGKGSATDGAGAGAGTGGQGYNNGSVSMHGGPGSTIYSAVSYSGGSSTGWASSGPGGGGDLGPGGNGGTNSDGGAGGLGGGGGGGNSDDWNTDGRGGAGGNGYVYVQWLYHNQSWYNPGTYSWSVPDGVYLIAITGAGGGGAGGGVIDTFNSSDYGAGGGGSSGQLIEKLMLNVMPGDIITVVVGNGGSIGDPASTGGGTTSVTNTTRSQQMVVLSGGRPGGTSKGANSWTEPGGAAPPVATFTGVNGTISTYSYAGQDAPGNRWSGAGGNGLFGRPGGSAIQAVSTHGWGRYAPAVPAGSYGAGGGGGASTDCNNGGACLGANGAPGCVIIQY